MQAINTGLKNIFIRNVQRVFGIRREIQPYNALIPVAYGEQISNHEIIAHKGMIRASACHQSIGLLQYSLYYIKYLFMDTNHPIKEEVVRATTYEALNNLCKNAQQMGATHVINLSVVTTELHKNIVHMDVHVQGEAVIAIKKSTN